MLKFKKRVREVNYKYSSLSGQISSKKLNKAIQFESSLERDFIYLLEFDRRVKNYIEQPLTIPYKDQDQKNRKYTPDFMISYHDKFRKNEVVEIKYEEHLVKHKKLLDVKFSAARLFCIEHNLLFRVCSDRYIRGKNEILLRNVKFLSRYRDYFDNINYERTGIRIDTENTFSILDKIRELRKTSITTIINSLATDKNKKAELIFLTWYLIANNFIECDLHSWLNLDSEVWID